MAVPLSGPVHKVITQTGDRQGSYVVEKYRWKQAKPYNLPAPYELTDQQTLYLDWQIREPTGGIVDGSNSAKSPAFHYADTEDQPQWALFISQTLDQARAKFVGEMNDSAMLAVNFAERAQAIAMMTKRITQLSRFVRKLNRFDFPGAANELGMSREAFRAVKDRKNLRRNAKSLGDNFLEYHFGWEPLVGDIHATIELLQAPMTNLLARGRKSARYTRNDRQEYFGSLTKTLYRGQHINTVKCLVQAEFEVTNPNLYLANRLGLTNPASVAWELVPFSFVVDWFVNVSDFLNQWSEFHGVSLKNPFYTVSVNTYCDGYRDSWYPYWDESDKTLYSAFHCQSRRVHVERKLGIPAVTLKTRAPKPLSVARGLTAISLLLQKLKG